MDLDFSPEQDALRETIRAVLAKECPMTLVRDVMEQRARPDALWATCAELGWPALTIAEADGGIGLGAVEAAILAEELGRVVAPGALLPTVTQFVPLVQACAADDAERARWLAPVAAGTLRASVAVAEPSTGYTVAATAATAERVADGLRLRGTKTTVFEGTDVDEIACTVRLGGDVRVVVVPRSALRATAVRAFDETRVYATIDLDDVVVAADRMLGGSSAAAVECALETMTVALALETVGVCQSIFDVALDYAKQREQFGVPIGSFQSMKHKFADLAIALERARATSYFAAACIDEDDERRAVAAAAAKAAAGDAQLRFGKEGIQILGGIGFTWEHDMHIYVKRAKANELCFGGAGAQRARIAELLGV